MSTIKCALCGAEWTVSKSTWTHPENDCPLTGSYTYRPIVLAVNRALEAAKVDARKPEECKFYGANYWDAMPLIAMPDTELVRCKEGLKKMYCPCAAWRKE